RHPRRRWFRPEAIERIADRRTIAFSGLQGHVAGAIMCCAVINAGKAIAIVSLAQRSFPLMDWPHGVDIARGLALARNGDGNEIRRQWTRLSRPDRQHDIRMALRAKRR